MRYGHKKTAGRAIAAWIDLRILRDWCVSARDESAYKENNLGLNIKLGKGTL